MGRASKVAAQRGEAVLRKEPSPKHSSDILRSLYLTEEQPRQVFRRYQTSITSTGLCKTETLALSSSLHDAKHLVLV